MKNILFLCSSLTFIVLLTNCGEQQKITKIVSTPSVNTDQEISAKEIADALGIHRVIVKFPMNSEGDSYGIAIKHKDGFFLSGSSVHRTGDKVKILYWMENKILKYYIQSSNGSVAGNLEIDNSIDFTFKSVPNSQMAYNAGEIFEKWSINEKMTANGNLPENLEPGEIGVCFIKYDKNLKSEKINVSTHSEVK